jgi:hypothetical protein
MDFENPAPRRKASVMPIRASSEVARRNSANEILDERALGYESLRASSPATDDWEIIRAEV